MALRKCGIITKTSILFWGSRGREGDIPHPSCECLLSVASSTTSWTQPSLQITKEPKRGADLFLFLSQSSVVLSQASVRRCLTQRRVPPACRHSQRHLATGLLTKHRDILDHCNESEHEEDKDFNSDNNSDDHHEESSLYLTPMYLFPNTSQTQQSL